MSILLPGEFFYEKKLNDVLQRVQSQLDSRVFFGYSILNSISRNVGLKCDISKQHVLNRLTI